MKEMSVEKAYRTLLKLRREMSIEEMVEMLPFLGINVELLDEIETLVNKEKVGFSK